MHAKTNKRIQPSTTQTLCGGGFLFLRIFSINTEIP